MPRPRRDIENENIENDEKRTEEMRYKEQLKEHKRRII